MHDDEDQQRQKICENMRMHLVFFLFILSLIRQSCLDLRAEASAVSSGYEFVRTRGVQFLLNGDPFYANGFNAYWLMYEASYPSYRFRISTAFRNASSRGLTVARTWAFSDGGYRPLQYSPGFYNEQVFQGLDFVIAEARRYGIKLILSLANNYESFGGKKQYVNWARNKGQYLASDDNFFTNPLVKGFYKNHIKTILNRFNTFTRIPYKDDPTIMAWELMNEPRCSSDPSGRTVQAWITEMAAYLKSIDRNHLLEAGLEGFYGQSSPQRSRLNPSNEIGTDFVANNLMPSIDFATVHLYPDQWLSNSSDETEMDFINRWLDAHIRDAEFLLHKPIIVAEFGKSVKTQGFSPYKRDMVFSTVYSKIYESAERGGAAAGGLFWQLLGEGMDNFQDGFGILLNETSSTVNLICQQSQKLVLIGKNLARVRNSERWKRKKEISRVQRHGRNGGHKFQN